MSWMTARASTTDVPAMDHKALLKDISRSSSLPDLMRQEDMYRMRLANKVEGMSKLQRELHHEQRSAVAQHRKDEHLRKSLIRPIGIQAPQPALSMAYKPHPCYTQHEMYGERLREVQVLESLLAAMQKRKDELHSVDRQSNSLRPIQASGCARPSVAIPEPFGQAASSSGNMHSIFAMKFVLSLSNFFRACRARSVTNMQKWFTSYGQPARTASWKEWRSSSPHVQKVLKGETIW
eukprot:TRINITY_DN8909_c0_g1_i2.p1 TRINITY_DN8909_c0_g1~~TRINITY_DN8909_c0_g1_i2.p1  ORF type:complete len:236 (-),score=45.41 TRINITY_DN8909_c0_g1_i2:32-739(-)